MEKGERRGRKKHGERGGERNIKYVFPYYFWKWSIKRGRVIWGGKQQRKKYGKIREEREERKGRKDENKRRIK